MGDRSLLAAALMLLLALPAWAQATAPATPEVAFRDAAKTVTASIQSTLYDAKTGGYVQSVRQAEPEFMWGNGVMFSALVAAARSEPETYKPVMERFFSSMDRYWDSKAKIPGYEPAPTRGDGHDKYYDDNQWMVITFMEAYELTHDVKYLDRAEKTLKFSLSGWDEQLGGGIWWHEGHKGGAKNTCANAPAAVACLRVARSRNLKENVDWARRIVAWTNAHLQDKDGLFFDNIRVADSHIGARKYTYNTALMLRANLGLYRATGEAQYLSEAKRIGAACDTFVDAKTGGYRDGMKFTHLLVEADLELYRATRDAPILARARRNGQAAWKKWEASPPTELIERAGMARMFWLLAEQESDAGKAFWAKADQAPEADR